MITNNNRVIIQKPKRIIKKTFDYQYLKSMNPFILSLVIYFVGSRLRILRISWYKCMTPFRDNLRSLERNICASAIIHSLVYTTTQKKKCWVEWVGKISLTIKLILVLIVFSITLMILVIWMNFHIWSHSKDEYDTKEYT